MLHITPTTGGETVVGRRGIIGWHGCLTCNPMVPPSSYTSADMGKQTDLEQTLTRLSLFTNWNVCGVEK